MGDVVHVMRAFSYWCKKHNLKHEGATVEFRFPTERAMYQAQDAMRRDFETVVLDGTSRDGVPNSCYGIPFKFTT